MTTLLILLVIALFGLTLWQLSNIIKISRINADNGSKALSQKKK